MAEEHLHKMAPSQAVSVEVYWEALEPTAASAILKNLTEVFGWPQGFQFTMRPYVED